MEISKKKIGINMISGSIGFFFPMAINFFTAPYVLHELGEQAFGIQVIANVVIGYLIVADMGLDIPVTHRIAEHHAKKEFRELSRLIFSTFKLYTVIGAAGALILSILAKPLVSIFEIPAAFEKDAAIVFYLSAIGFFASVINMWGKAVFNGFQRYDIANGAGVLNNLIGIIGGLAAIYLGYGVAGFFLARVIGLLIASAIYTAQTLKRISNITLWPIVDIEIWNSLKQQVGYGFLLRMSGMIFARLDQVLIGTWVAISAVAVYSFPVLLTTSISGLIASATHFIFPMVSSLNATNSTAKIVNVYYQITKFIVIVSTIAFVPLLFLGQNFVTLWLNPSVAEEGRFVLALLTLSAYVNACLNIGLNAVVAGFGKLRYFAIYSIVRGCGLSISFLFLIKPFGINGAALAYLITILIDSVFVVISVRKFNFNLVDLFSVAYLKPILIGGLLGIGLYFIRDFATSWGILLTVGICYAAVYLMLVYFFSSKEDKTLVHSLMQKFLPNL